jgi:phosphate transport system substrate-binding protein
MVDHAEASETRQALRPYPVFKTAAFKTVGGATILSENTPEALAKALGKEGIGYLLVGQLEGQSALRALELHKTPPTDARYPFSQPYSYVYAGGASPAAMAFLGYATGSPGQSAIEQANLSGNGVSSSASGATAAAGTNAGATAGATDGTAASGANGGGGENIPGAAGSNSTSTGADTNAGTGADSGGEASAPTGAITDAAGSERWWWLLLPLAGLGLLIWAAGRRGSEEETGYIANADRDDDRIRRSFEGSGFEDTALPGTQLGAARVGIDNPDVDSSQFTASGPSMGKVIAGGSAIAGGAAAGLAGRAKAASGDVTMDLSAVDLDEGRANDGIRNITRDVRETTGSMGNIPSNIQAGTGGIEGVRTRIQGQIDGVEEMGAGARTHLQGHLQGGSDSLRQTFTAETTEGSWLDRAKQRINEATEQIKDTAADIKDDITKE